MSKGEKVRESSLLGGVVDWHQGQRGRLLTFGVRDHWHWCQNEKLSQLVKQFMSRCSQHQCKCQQATNYVLDKSRNIVVWRRSTLKSAKSLPDSKIYMIIRQRFTFTAINSKCPQHIKAMPAVWKRWPQTPVANNVYACRRMHCWNACKTPALLTDVGRLRRHGITVLDA